MHGLVNPNFKQSCVICVEWQVKNHSRYHLTVKYFGHYLKPSLDGGCNIVNRNVLIKEFSQNYKSPEIARKTDNFGARPRCLDMD